MLWHRLCDNLEFASAIRGCMRATEALARNLHRRVDDEIFEMMATRGQLAAAPTLRDELLGSLSQQLPIPGSKRFRLLYPER